MNTLEIESINLAFGDRVILSDIYLKCTTGSVVGLLGRNGTGKSSLFKIAFGAIKAQNKSIRFNSKSISEYSDIQNIITYLPQKSFVPKSFKVNEVFSDFGISRDEFITSFPRFRSKLRASFRHLSNGESRLIEAYIIIKSASSFSLLDEPFTYISPLEIKVIKEIITEQKKQKGFIITDHRYQDILDIQDDLYFLKEGIIKPIMNSQELKKMGYPSD